jgi:monothiol glutaredoxin
MMDREEAFELIDVRTPDERAFASIDGSRLLDRQVHDDLLTRARDTSIVFQCHHGMRSQAAAEYFSRHGFTKLFNLAGGIDAWSRDVDPAVPRY